MKRAGKNACDNPVRQILPGINHTASGDLEYEFSSGSPTPYM